MATKQEILDHLIILLKADEGSQLNQRVGDLVDAMKLHTEQGGYKAESAVHAARRELVNALKTYDSEPIATPEEVVKTTVDAVKQGWNGWDIHGSGGGRKPSAIDMLAAASQSGFTRR